MKKQTNINPEYIKQYRIQLGEKIKTAREANKLTLEEVSDYCGVTPSTVSKVETGAFNNGIDLYVKIAMALNLKISLT